MALMSCHECGKQVSSESKTCPSCGVKTKKPASLTAKLFVVLVGIGVVSAIVSKPPAEPPKTPEQLAQEERETAQYIAAANTSKAIRAAMREPDSLEYISLRVSDDAKIVCAEYRARNGFGGMNIERMAVTSTHTGQDSKTWNKHCTQPLHDMMWAAK